MVRSVVLALCAVFVAGVFAAIFLSIWSTHGAAGRPRSFPQSLAAELAWAAIPCLMVVAAAIPAVIAILGGRTD
jgi:heme/copper-type cytochrome/quinol oxidase subunit 2